MVFYLLYYKELKIKSNEAQFLLVFLGGGLEVDCAFY